MPSFNTSAEPEAQRGNGAPPLPSRLNPFAFISDTSLRFTLLIVLVAVASGVYWVHIGGNWTYIGIAPNVEDPQEGFDACLRGNRVIGPAMFEAEEMRLGLACAATYAQQHVPFILGGLALLSAVTLVIYTLMPVWIGHRWHASILRDEDMPGLSHELQALVSRAGLQRAPLFLWNPLGTMPAALAYGAFSRHRVVMTGALVAHYFTEPAAFRALLLHELAHLRNGDVPKAMLAVAVWWAFLASVLPPYFYVVVAKPFNLFDVGYGFLRTVAVAALVLLMRNAVLRSRELYADVRVFTRGGEPNGLAIMLRQLRATARWWGCFSPHPPTERRLQLRGQTDELFRFGVWDAFGLGAATSVLALFSMLLTSFIIVKPGLTYERVVADDTTLVFLVFLVLGIPLTVVVVFGFITAAVVTWRSEFQTLMRGRRGKGIFCVSFSFSAGALAAFSGLVILTLVDPDTTKYVAIPAATIFIPLLLVGALVVWLLLGALLSIYLYWVDASAVTWLPFLLHRQRAGAALTVSLVSTFLLAVLAPLLISTVVVAAGPLGEGGSTGLLATVWHLALIGSAFPYNVIVLPSIVVLWAWPLAPAVLARFADPGNPEGWAWLDSAPAEGVPPLARLCLGRAVLIGIVSGAACGLVLDRLGQFLPEEWARAASMHGEAVPLHVRMMLSAILVQVLAATLTVLAAPRLRPVHALLSANTAGLAMAIAIRLHLLAYDGWREPGLLQTAELLVQPIIIGGAAAALPTALLIGMLLGRKRSSNALV